MKRKAFSFLTAATLVIIAACICIDYYASKNIAIRYTEILSIHDQESFDRVKANIYNISPKEVKEGLFSKEEYELKDQPPAKVRVLEVRLEKFKGLGHYVFLNRFEVIGWREVESLVYVKDRIVYEVHRKD